MPTGNSLTLNNSSRTLLNDDEETGAEARAVAGLVWKEAITNLCPQLETSVLLTNHRRATRFNENLMPLGNQEKLFIKHNYIFKIPVS